MVKTLDIEGFINKSNATTERYLKILRENKYIGYVGANKTEGINKQTIGCKEFTCSFQCCLIGIKTNMTMKKISVIKNYLTTASDGKQYNSNIFGTTVKKYRNHF
jgi:hypothetical protein